MKRQPGGECEVVLRLTLLTIDLYSIPVTGRTSGNIPPTSPIGNSLRNFSTHVRVGDQEQRGEEICN